MITYYFAKIVKNREHCAFATIHSFSEGLRIPTLYANSFGRNMLWADMLMHESIRVVFLRFISGLVQVCVNLYMNHFNRIVLNDSKPPPLARSFSLRTEKK